MEIVSAAEQNNQGPLHQANERIHGPLQRWLPQLAPRYMEAWDEERRTRFALELGQARDRLAVEVAAGLPDDVRGASAATIDAIERWALASEQQAIAFGKSLHAQYLVTDTVARVMVVFAPRRRVTLRGHRPALVVSSASTEAAEKIAGTIGVAATLLAMEVQKGGDPGVANQAVSHAIAAIGAPVREFALATNRAVRRRVWV